MRRIGFLGLLACLVGACSFNIKTMHVADYGRLDTVSFEEATRNSIERMIGRYQSKGIHVLDGKKYDFYFHFGMAGTFSLSGGNGDIGQVLTTYHEDGRLMEMIYANALVDGEKVEFGAEYPIRLLAEKISVGETSIAIIFETFGRPPFIGRRYNREHGIEHNVAMYDASESGNNKPTIEKWMLVGYDRNGIIQDLVWMSSDQTEIGALGQVEQQKMRMLSGLGLDDTFVKATVSGDTIVDPVQVDALLSTNPRRLSEITDVLGNPTAIGFKNFKEHEPMVFASYRTDFLEVVGTVNGYVPPSQRNKSGIKPQTFHQVKQENTLLWVGSDINGNILEIAWLKPVN